MSTAETLWEEMFRSLTAGLPVCLRLARYRRSMGRHRRSTARYRRSMGRHRRRPIRYRRSMGRCRRDIRSRRKRSHW